MKTFLFSALALASALAFTPEPAQATVSSAVAVRILFSSGASCTNCGNVTTSTWVDLVASTSRAIKGIDILNFANVPFQVSVGASGSEVVQLVVPPSHLNDGVNAGVTGLFASPANGGPHFYPIAISQGQKVSIRALNSSATGSELEANFYYY